MALTATRHGAGDPAIACVLALLRSGFASMAGRIDPPSSLTRMGLADLRHACGTGEVWSLGPPPVACMVLTPKPDHLYLGKLCLDAAHRGAGLARRLVALAEARARAHGRACIDLQTRVELTENHATFARLGFVEVGRHAHPGFDRPTSITFRRAVPVDPAPTER